MCDLSLRAYSRRRVLIARFGCMSGPPATWPRPERRRYDLCRAGRWTKAILTTQRSGDINEAFAPSDLAACIKAGLTIQAIRRGADPVPRAPCAANSKSSRRIGELDVSA